MPPRGQRARIDELLELVALKGREHERVETYSRGMRQRLHIARGLLHDPPVLFLDEPTIGLDPVGARELRQTIAHLQQTGKTILLTTHYMFEADELCQRVAVIRDGSIVASGTPAHLKSRIADRTVVEIEAFGASDAMIERLRAVAGVTSVSVELREQAQVILVQSSRGAELVNRCCASSRRHVSARSFPGRRRSKTPTSTSSARRDSPAAQRLADPLHPALALGVGAGRDHGLADHLRDDRLLHVRRGDDPDVLLTRRSAPP